MKRILLIACLCSGLHAFAQRDTLYLVFQEGTELPAYVNAAGDTVIQAGMFEVGLTQSFVDFAVVIPFYDSNVGAIAINPKGEKLFEVYWFDNGPDYILEDRFRILVDGAIGYANAKGEIVIEPKYMCADPFENGKARVTYECTKEHHGEYTTSISSTWFYIDLNGNPVKE